LIHVLPTHEFIDHLAGRIESAYGLRRSIWWRGCSTTRVWYTAALRLWEAHAADPVRIPLDAELFVASQPISAPLSDPWTEIAHPESARRFRNVVRQIVRQLRAELRREVALAERSLGKGNEIDALLSHKTRRLSALGSYIVARRAGRDDLAERLAPGAAWQHRSCPLYRTASLTLIPAEAYPDERLAIEIDEPVPERVARTEFATHQKYRECDN
jgi:hypothetical protein